MNKHSVLKQLLEATDSLKKEIASLKPLKPQELKELREYYKIGFTYSSNALEGNTLTESETKIVIEDGLTINGKSLKDHYETIGHANAYDFLFTIVKNNIITEKDILNFHKLFYEHLDLKSAGKYRKTAVFISGTTYLPPAPNKIKIRMQNLVQNLINWQKDLHPILFAATAHLELVNIHPFIDGNGRTARLLMNLILFKNGYPVTIIPPILRNDYILNIKTAQTEPYDKNPFYEFIAERVLESQKEYFRLIKIAKN